MSYVDHIVNAALSWIFHDQMIYTLSFNPVEFWSQKQPVCRVLCLFYEEMLSLVKSATIQSEIGCWHSKNVVSRVHCIWLLKYDLIQKIGQVTYGEKCFFAMTNVILHPPDHRLLVRVFRDTFMAADHQGEYGGGHGERQLEHIRTEYCVNAQFFAKSQENHQHFRHQNYGVQSPADVRQRQSSQFVLFTQSSQAEIGHPVVFRHGTPVREIVHTHWMAACQVWWHLQNKTRVTQPLFPTTNRIHSHQQALYYPVMFSHSGIIPIGQFSRKCAKSINQA